MSLVSIIVCTYNQEDTIRRCLDAILSQKCSWPFEIIIGEDAGTDNTRHICEDYVSQYPDIVRLMPKSQNKGLLQNYFDCVRAARGKYLMECGGDDEWMPGRIQTCLDIMEVHPDVGMVVTPYITRILQTGKELPLNPTPWHEGIYPGDELTYRHACATNCSPGAFAMTRLSMLQEVMQRWPRFFSGREFLMEDLQMAVCMGFVGKMYYSEKPTFYYYVGGANVCGTDDYEKKLRFERNALFLLHTLTEELPLDKDKVMPALLFRFCVVLMHSFRVHDKKARNEILNDARKWNIALNNRSLLIKSITSNPFTWKAMLMIRKIFVGIKELR